MSKITQLLIDDWYQAHKKYSVISTVVFIVLSAVVEEMGWMMEGWQLTVILIVILVCRFIKQGPINEQNANSDK